MPLLLVALLVASGCGERRLGPLDPSEFCLGKLQLDMSEDEVLAVMGEPVDKVPNLVEGQTYQYIISDSEWLVVGIDSKGVYWISIDRCDNGQTLNLSEDLGPQRGASSVALADLATPRSIGVGSNAKTLKARYGKAPSMNFVSKPYEIWQYYSDDMTRGIGFWISDGMVRLIAMFRPSENYEE